MINFFSLHFSIIADDSLVCCFLSSQRLIVQLLLDAGAATDIRRGTGQTARDIAAHPIIGFPVIVAIMDDFDGSSSTSRR